MANPKCGSCRFFQEADLPGSGWCHHPQRKVSSDVKILVRRNELACRDEWSRSYWQPITGQEPDAPPSFERHLGSGPVQPASRENLHALLNRDVRADSSEGEDIFLGEGRIVSEAHEAWVDPPRPFPAGNFDPRTAIFRAREAYREKARAKAAAERQSAGLEALAGEIDQNIKASDPGDRAVEPAGIPLEEFPDRNAVSFARESAEGHDERTGRQAVSSESSVTAGAGLEASAQLAGLTPAMEAWQLAEADTERESDRRRDEQHEVCVPEPLLPTEEIPPALTPRATSPDSDLPEWFRTDLPHVCRACRDFRPATDGQLGWCANAWAFTHRQMVQEDDVSPCHSAIGDWWVPVDDVWLVAADVSSHGRATPLLDRLTGEAEAKRRRS